MVNDLFERIGYLRLAAGNELQILPLLKIGKYEYLESFPLIRIVTTIGM